MEKHAIQPTRECNYPEWYQQVVIAADLAEHSTVRGCMIIKPWGYALWEQIQAQLDQRIKSYGVDNIYCPLFIPLDSFEKEAAHIEGFAKECAVVTHSRLETKNGKLQPAAELEQPLVVRPTSEMIIGDLMAKWIQSHRDLPLKLNQWANVVRWEMRTRLFLRTSEFLWQEGHTAHATEKEAYAYSEKMIAMYHSVCKHQLALPAIIGEKSMNERFPGADVTFTIEGMMQDKKALQLGTSHHLGQNFSKACQIQFQDESGSMQNAWTTSWGVTTRLIGALIMTHADDDGMRMPPRIAPLHIVILPIARKGNISKELKDYCTSIASDLEKIIYHGQALRVKIDNSTHTGGRKNWSWIKKGVPLRLEIGERELEKNCVCLYSRGKAHKEKNIITPQQLTQDITLILDEYHQQLYNDAHALMHKHCYLCTSWDLLPQITQQPGFYAVYWREDNQRERELQERYGLSIRCFLSSKESPFDWSLEGACVFDPDLKGTLAILAKAY